MESLSAPPLPSRRRIEAQRLARVLLPAYRDVGWVSTRLVVRMGQRWVAPDLAAAVGEPPVDGRLVGPPHLVVVLRHGPVAPTASWPGSAAPAAGSDASTASSASSASWPGSAAAAAGRDAVPGPHEWLEAGAAAVWELGTDVVVEHRVAGLTGLRRRGDRLTAPGPQRAIAVDELLPRPGQRSARLG